LIAKTIFLVCHNEIFHCKAIHGQGSDLQITNNVHNIVVEDLSCNNQQNENVVQVECHLGNCEDDTVEVNITKENLKYMTTKEDMYNNSVTKIQTHQKVNLS
jgi:hypothetical protein